MRFFHSLGKYFIFLSRVFAKPERFYLYYHQILREIVNLGISSIGIVAIISVFIGAVLTIQTAINANTPLFPHFLIALAVRDSMILEFSSTIIALILAGKVGSNISSEIGTMRITEQIDALEIMGVNSASYLVLPKIIAAMLFNPILMIVSNLVGILGGLIAGTATGIINFDTYVYGLQYSFHPFYITYSLIKTVIFAFLITSISSYHGYYVSGGSLDVGKASTKAVVFCSITILFFNLILTQLLLV